MPQKKNEEFCWHTNREIIQFAAAKGDDFVTFCVPIIVKSTRKSYNGVALMNWGAVLELNLQQFNESDQFHSTTQDSLRIALRDYTQGLDADYILL